MQNTIAPPAHMSSDRPKETDGDKKWSVRRTVFFCLLVNGLFWGGLAFALMRFFA